MNKDTSEFIISFLMSYTVVSILCIVIIEVMDRIKSSKEKKKKKEEDDE